ncbi:hypothetical protein [uncultured Bradyrhizobium sp.]|uniref:hypothetical protein n=1 Tax=uncultured Bradyrhizobium sp. TaxID=199684 RepID=UPI0035CB29E2
MVVVIELRAVLAAAAPDLDRQGEFHSPHDVRERGFVHIDARRLNKFVSEA